MASSRGSPSVPRRQSSTPHYQTLPTSPPRSKGRPYPHRESTDSSLLHRDGDHGDGEPREETPLPKKQLAMLAVIALAEQTAFNSISPYLPNMALSFPGITQSNVGMYVGLIASAFALAQCVSGYFWGWLSDRIGRKPVILLGTAMTAACFLGFGFCRSLGAAIAVQTLMGLVNGNQGVVSTALGDITDRSNQGRAFTYLPVVYGLGGITGPAVGGLLVNLVDGQGGFWSKYPYLPPNLFSTAILLLDFVLTCSFLKESQEEVREMPPLKQRLETLFVWIWQLTSGSHRPSYVRTLSRRRRSRASYSGGRPHGQEGQSDNNHDETSRLLGGSKGNISYRDIFNRDTILILLTYLISALCNVAFNTLYPVFGESDPPIGRGLSTQEIGLSLSFAGVVTIVFQVGIYGRLRDKIGNRASYRASLLGFVVSFLLMPWVGHQNASQGKVPQTRMEKIWLWSELGAVLLIKTVATVSGLTSALLLWITNSAPSNAVLGQINGLAQTLGAGGRAVGPFLSGSLFSAATRIAPNGEAMPFGVFAAVAFIGFLMSCGIRNPELEGEGWDEESESEDRDRESNERGRRP